MEQNTDIYGQLSSTRQTSQSLTSDISQRTGQVPACQGLDSDSNSSSLVDPLSKVITHRRLRAMHSYATGTDHRILASSTANETKWPSTGRNRDLDWAHVDILNLFAPEDCCTYCILPHRFERSLVVFHRQVLTGSSYPDAVRHSVAGIWHRLWMADWIG